MFKYTFTLAAALYAGFVVWGEPQDLGSAEAATQTPLIATTADARYTAPVILGDGATDAVVTRAATETVVPDAATIAASTPAPSAGQVRPRLIGEPVVVNLVRPAVATTTDDDTTAAAELSGERLRVTGSRVNMRSGPSTGNPVVGSLAEGTVAERLGDDQGGWVEIRDTATGRTGFMSARFLAPA